MKLETISIENFGICENIVVDLSYISAIVGENNSGKSTILKAIDFLINPSNTKISRESFWSLDCSLKIKIEGVFSNLNEVEKEKLKNYIFEDEKFYLSRTVKYDVEDSDDEESIDYENAKLNIEQLYKAKTVRYEWLNEVYINGNKIDKWWDNPEQLSVNGNSFYEFVENTKPTVSGWKEKAKEFIELNLTDEDFEIQWIPNPRGFPGVLRGALPTLIFIPAVRNLNEEIKTTKTNPMGFLMKALLDSITNKEDQKASIEKAILNIQMLLNRSGEDKRFSSIIETERKLNAVLKEYMDCELEIEFTVPTTENLISSPKIYINDGTRNLAKNKGHGMQRALIFSILRCYSDCLLEKEENNAKSIIFCIEEPEIYMHPQAQRTIRKVFQTLASKKNQIIYSTHSPMLIEVEFFDQVVRLEGHSFEVNGKKFRESKAWQILISQIMNDLKSRHPSVSPTEKSIRERYYHVYSPMRNEGFFARKIILVEGVTEQYALPIYAKSIDLDIESENIAIIECGGKDSIDRLYRIFNELGIPCYVIFDYDNDKVKETIDTSKKILKLIGYKEKVIDTIVECNFACFINDWEDTINQEVSNYDELKQKAKTDLGEVGKPLTERYIANILINSDPPFILPSIKEILIKAKEIEWSSSCLKE